MGYLDSGDGHHSDAVSYKSKTPEKCLETAKRKKKRNYINTCLNGHRHFTPFFILVDGLLGFEAEATLKGIASRRAQKWQGFYSCTCGYMKIGVDIALLRSTHRCIQGGWVPSSRISVI